MVQVEGFQRSSNFIAKGQMMKNVTVCWIVIMALLVASNAREAKAQTAKKPTYVSITCGAEKEKIGQQVKEYLVHEDFDKLTKLAQQYRDSKATLSDGSWKLNGFYEAFSCNSNNMDEWKAMLDRLEKWSKHEITDPAPIIAIGNAFWSFGRQARGNSFANTVSEEGWKLLHERLAKGRGRLVAESNKCKTCPGFFVVMMKLGIDGSMKRRPFMELFEQGITLEPTYPNFYEMKSYYILPRWYGESGELKEFVLATADRCPQAALWVLWRLQYQGVYKNVFEQEGIAWDAIKVKLKTCLESSPVGIGQANMLAYLSDVVGDTETRAAALKSVDYQLDASIWRSHVRLKEIANKLTDDED